MELLDRLPVTRQVNKLKTPRSNPDGFMRLITFKELRNIANSVGLEVVGIADVEALEQDREHLKRWQEAGYAADMAFMHRDPYLLSHPKKLMPTARSVVVIGAFYDRGERSPLPVGHGRVARYAWGRDYHKVLRTRLRALCRLAERCVGETIEWRVFSDSVPLLERALARQSGMGFVGKNSMVILPRAGSFLFLGEVLWNVEVSVESSDALPTIKSHCGSCSQCLNACPTSAFVQEKVLDARRCISYLTIEKRGYLSLEERTWLGEWVFGCDVCQDVCPFNALSINQRRKPDLPEFGADSGVGQSLDLVKLLGIRDDREFVGYFAGTPLMRAKREGLIRNAAIVAANTRFSDSLSALKVTVQEDASPVVRAHALWAHAVISGEEGSRALRATKHLLVTCGKDQDEKVRAEASELMRKFLH